MSRRDGKERPTDLRGFFAHCEADRAAKLRASYEAVAAAMASEAPLASLERLGMGHAGLAFDLRKERKRVEELERELAKLRVNVPLDNGLCPVCRGSRCSCLGSLGREAYDRQEALLRELGRRRQEQAPEELVSLRARIARLEERNDEREQFYREATLAKRAAETCGRSARRWKALAKRLRRDLPGSTAR